MKKIDQPLEMTNVLEHRREECIHYASCLEEASAMLWQSFSCAECKQFLRDVRPSPSYHRAASPLAWEI